MAMNLGKKGYQSDINITPYIDILLVLLIIFMTAVPMKRYEHEVRTPQAASELKTDLPPAKSLIIEMKLDHSLLLNKEPVTLEELEPTLTSALSRTAIRDVFIRGDSKLPYGDIFVLLDIARRSGASNIALLSMEPLLPARDTRASR